MNSRLRRAAIWNLASALPGKKDNTPEVTLRLVGDSEACLIYEISEPLVFRKFAEAQAKGCDLFISFKSIKEYPPPTKNKRTKDE